MSVDIFEAEIRIGSFGQGFLLELGQDRRRDDIPKVRKLMEKVCSGEGNDEHSQRVVFWHQPLTPWGHYGRYGPYGR